MHVVLYLYTGLCVGAVFISDDVIFRVNNIGSHAYKLVYGMGGL